MTWIVACLRRLRTKSAVFNKRPFLEYGRDLHVGRGSTLWAPRRLLIGHDVYLGKHVHIEANCEIGDYCLFANRVAIVGRHDHDVRAVGYPARYSPWAGSVRKPAGNIDEKAVVESDVWLGYGVIVLTGVTNARGAIVAAGSVVSADIPPYCIAAGVPARVIGRRFTSEVEIARHEEAIARGRFGLSERGYDYCTILPGLSAPERDP